MFQFTHPRGVRFQFLFCKAVFNVSIHAPARGAIIVPFGWEGSMGFNSRTREGCDLSNEKSEPLEIVSIHAPARGAIGSMANIHKQSRFNSRTREGCDVKIWSLLTRTAFQFTHPRGVRWVVGNL